MTRREESGGERQWRLGSPQAVRPRKAKKNDVVLLHTPRYAVIVDIREEANPPYIFVDVNDRRGRGPRGPAVQREATDFTPTGYTSKPPGRIYRRNLKEYGLPEERGCGCHCCVHQEGVEPEPDE